MNNTPEDTLKAWREEYHVWFFEGSEFPHTGCAAEMIREKSEPYRQGLNSYLAARSRAQVEIDNYKEMYKKAFIRDQIHQDEIAKLNELIQEIYTYAKMHIPKLQTSSISRFIDDWYKKAEALK